MAGIAPILAIAGTVVSAVGTIAAGNAAQASAEFQAKQADARAAEERAAGQRDSMEAEHKTGLVLQRQQALAAGSGFDALSPSFVNLAGDTAARGEYQARMSQYGADVRGQDYNLRASGLRMTGQADQTAGYIGAAGTILQGGVNWYDKYGQGGPSAGATTSSYYG